MSTHYINSLFSELLPLATYFYPLARLLALRALQIVLLPSYNPSKL